jgi:hypothetical protein
MKMAIHIGPSKYSCEESPCGNAVAMFRGFGFIERILIGTFHQHGLAGVGEFQIMRGSDMCFYISLGFPYFENKHVLVVFHGGVVNAYWILPFSFLVASIDGLAIFITSSRIPA